MLAEKSLGIIGGTFDPIHYGHLTAAECARDEFQLERVIFMPAYIPPHKCADKISDPRDRLTMVEKATANNPAFTVSTLEMDRKGCSYTVDTIDYFLQTYPATRLYFIMGVDSLILINTWKDYNRLVGLCQFIVVTRPGFELNRNDENFADVSDVLWDNMHLLPMPGNVVSSSEIRSRVLSGKTIKYLVPPDVEEYIGNRGLYRQRS